ncbi:hypothetical protein Arnit_2773 [Arcobacter nitrofigilis DSM 7299]|uniref:Cache domain-containing protein n=1 Tax=Arcobacter nitrofigilis (strain ATCC 33309 / DSM 7299 / CCUG 15893 / LMG 7604 / NCTC 12251 / CI) TaxID=572480 RepID=D5V701_ARCNC|nr:cache domain-containing protein [Arcobacter nitrofigilis]ADG94421.1 hypothetical protein Arnit_2773 [Arcobacter nitrofigilis DSM 7299]
MFKRSNFLYFFIIFLISIIFSIQYFYKKQKEEQYLIQVNQNKSKQINNWILEKKHFMEKLSKNIENKNYNKEVFLKIMKETNKKMKTHSVFLGLEDGNYLDTQGYWIDGFDPRVRPWYIETIKQEKTTITGPMYYNDISGQEINWWAISSLIKKEGKNYGVISSEINPEMLIKLLNDIKHSKIEDLFLFDKNSGIIIASIKGENELKLVQNIFSKKFFENLPKTKETSLIKVDENRKAIVTNLKEAPWILCMIVK